MRCPSDISARVKISVVSVVVKGSVIVDLVPKIIRKGVAGHIFYNLVEEENKVSNVCCLWNIRDFGVWGGGVVEWLGRWTSNPEVPR